jgi:hypothetical protein
VQDLSLGDASRSSLVDAVDGVPVVQNDAISARVRFANLADKQGEVASTPGGDDDTRTAADAPSTPASTNDDDGDADVSATTARTSSGISSSSSVRFVPTAHGNDVGDEVSVVIGVCDAWRHMC